MATLGSFQTKVGSSSPSRRSVSRDNISGASAYRNDTPWSQQSWGGKSGSNKAKSRKKIIDGSRYVTDDEIEVDLRRIFSGGSDSEGKRGDKSILRSTKEVKKILTEIKKEKADLIKKGDKADKVASEAIKKAARTAEREIRMEERIAVKKASKEKVELIRREAEAERTTRKAIEKATKIAEKEADTAEKISHRAIERATRIAEKETRKAEKIAKREEKREMKKVIKEKVKRTKKTFENKIGDIKVHFAKDLDPHDVKWNGKQRKRRVEIGKDVDRDEFTSGLIEISKGSSDFRKAGGFIRGVKRADRAMRKHGKELEVRNRKANKKNVSSRSSRRDATIRDLIEG